MWFVFALLSAVFAALTSILAKIGIEGVASNLATAIRTVVVLVMSWGMVFLTNTQGGINGISRKSWLFLILSGLATGASWLCYYRALQIGDASKVVPIDKLSVVITLVLAFVFLHEQFTVKSLLGCALIGAGAGALVMALVSVPYNYFVVYPAYVVLYHLPLEAIIGMYQAINPSVDGLLACLLTFNLPFTLFKGLLDAALCFLIYKPLSPILHGRK